MNRNLGINDDDPNQNIPVPVDVHGQLLPDAPGKNQQRGQEKWPIRVCDIVIKSVVFLRTWSGIMSSLLIITRSIG